MSGCGIRSCVGEGRLLKGWGHGGGTAGRGRGGGGAGAAPAEGGRGGVNTGADPRGGAPWVAARCRGVGLSDPQSCRRGMRAEGVGARRRGGGGRGARDASWDADASRPQRRQQTSGSAGRRAAGGGRMPGRRAVRSAAVSAGPPDDEVGQCAGARNARRQRMGAGCRGGVSRRADLRGETPRMSGGCRGVGPWDPLLCRRGPADEVGRAGAREAGRDAGQGAGHGAGRRELAAAV